MWLIYLFFLLFFHSGGAVIYKLNKSDYYRMPDLYRLDAYYKCLHENDGSGVYCYSQFHLVTEEPSDLMHMIQEYSARTETHPNHTRLAYGICLTSTCKDFYTNNTTGDRKAILEACLNDTLWREYKLKAKIIDSQFSCTTADDVSTYKIDILDSLVAILFLALLGLNVIECVREIYYGTDKCPQGNDFLACFSIPQNWAKLTSHADGPDPRLTRLKFMQGFKGMITFPVLMAHACLKLFIASDDASGIDYYYENHILTQILVVGGPLMQVFFAVAGFLLAYNFEIIAEKKKISPAWIPTAIGQRWLKLFVPLVVIVAFYSTWIQHLGSGPLWQSVVQEAQACRSGWWKNLLFINNYIDQQPGQLECIISTWYLVTDLQLYILGVLLLILTTGLRRKILLSVLTLAGFIAIAAHTYYQDLDGTFFFSPEVARTLWFQDVADPTFKHVYKRAHTNVPAYLVGIAAGLAAFHLAKSGFKLDKYPFLNHPSFGLLNLFILLPFTVYSYTYMYPQAPRPSLLVRTAYAVLSRVALLAFTAMLLILMVLKDNDKARDYLSWQGWAVPSRLALSAYFVHFAIIKVITGSITSLTTLKFSHRLLDACGILSFIFVGAMFFHLLVEAPLGQLVKMYVLPINTKEVSTLKEDSKVVGKKNVNSEKEKGKGADSLKDNAKGDKLLRQRILSRKLGE